MIQNKLKNIKSLDEIIEPNFSSENQELDYLAKILMRLKRSELQEKKTIYYNEKMGDVEFSTKVFARKRKKTYFFYELFDSEIDDNNMDTDYITNKEKLKKNDDSEWKENVPNSNHIKGNKIRKKAPSGSVCEKHKRWKKRCPEWCPLREKKIQGITNELPTDSINKLKWNKEEVIEFVNVIGSSQNSSCEFQWNNGLKSLSTLLLSNIHNLFKPTNKIEFMNILRWSLNQLKKEGISTHILEEMERRGLNINFENLKNYHSEEEIEPENKFDKEEESEEQKKNESKDYYEEKISDISNKLVESHSSIEMRNIFDNNKNSFFDFTYQPTIKEKIFRKSNYSNSKNYFSFPTIACEIHTKKHARCPPNCPDRRPAIYRPRKRKKNNSLKDNNNHINENEDIFLKKNLQGVDIEKIQMKKII